MANRSLNNALVDTQIKKAKPQDKDYTLADARAKRDEVQRLVSKGIDPVEAKHEAKKETEASVKGQLHLVIKEWTDTLTCKESTKKKIYRMFERDVLPYFCKYDKNHLITAY